MQDAPDASHSAPGQGGDEARGASAPDLALTKSPSLDQIEALAHEAFARLPALFQRSCRGLVIRVEDFPDDETMAQMDAEPFDLLGLFRGFGLAQQGAGPASGQLPNSVYLYRRALLDYWAEHDETLGALVTHVLVHEIGHHLGFDDDDLDRIEAGAGPEAEAGPA